MMGSGISAVCEPPTIAVAIVASAAGESWAKAKRITRETRAIHSEPLSQEMSLTSH